MPASYPVICFHNDLMAEHSIQPEPRLMLPSPDEAIPISAVQHAVYCLRQAALIHIERLWEENRFTAEGRVLHEVVHEKGQRWQKGVRRVHALPIASARLGLAGVADLVEFRMGEDGQETPYPVEFKRGKAKAHRADEAQLCAQALCLEEMTGQPVPEGALFYGETKRRKIVALDEELRRLTEDAAVALQHLFASGRTPPAAYRHNLCRACSLLELCRPQAGRKSALSYRARSIASQLSDEADPARQP